MNLFNRFEIESEVYVDDLFRHFDAKDLESDGKPVLVVQLKKPWCDDQGVVNSLIEYFEILQGLKARDIIRVQLIAKNKSDGFGVVLERPSGINLVDIDELDSVISATDFIDRLCDAIHKANVKGIVHGYLRRQDIWIDGETVRVSGFGHSVLLQSGWSNEVIEVAPELKLEKSSDSQVDVYSIARLITECYPDSKSNPVLERALEPSAKQRFKKIRVFQSELLRSWSAPTGTGIKPKNKPLEKGEDESGTDENLGHELEPVNSEKPGWHYFGKHEFESNKYNEKELFQTINKVYYSNKLSSAEKAIDVLNFTLETTSFYNLWAENQGGVAELNRSLDTIEKNTRSYRSKPFRELKEKHQKKIVCLNRKLLEFSYPEICPKANIKNHCNGGIVRLLTGMMAFLLVVTLVIFVVQYYLNNIVVGHNGVTENGMLNITAGTYHPSPYLKRFFRAMGSNPVVIDRDFSFQIGEVTVGEFKQYVNTLDDPARERIGFLWKQDIVDAPYSNIRPVDYVSRRDAIGYAQWLSKKYDVDMRLPTYAQWVAAVVSYAETNPVLSSNNNSPMEQIRNKPDHLIGNLREWSSEACGNSRFHLLGEDYMSGKESLGELPCVKDTSKLKGVGFRLIRIN